MIWRVYYDKLGRIEKSVGTHLFLSGMWLQDLHKTNTMGNNCSEIIKYKIWVKFENYLMKCSKKNTII